MTRLLTADTCPACTGVHGQPTDWPVCPEHGHWLYVVSGPLNTGTWTYACQARNCKHTHTQKEKATMTATHENTKAALAIRDGQEMFTPKQLAALTQLGIENAPNADLAVFMHRCQATGLDPFSNQITMIKRGGKWTIQTEIDGYRVIAHRAARRDGVELSYGPTYWYDAAGGKRDVWTGDGPPVAASVTVYKDGKPFPGVARFTSFAAYKDGQLVRQWATMPDHMIAKCAEAQALRKAFPQDLDGIHTADEAAGVVTIAQQRPPAEPDPALRTDRARPVPSVPRGDIEGLRAAIRSQFEALGLDDEEEREVYVCKLANRDPAKGAAVLSERDLRFAVDALADCADIGELQDLCAPPETS